MNNNYIHFHRKTVMKLNQKDFAFWLGINQSNVSHWESGRVTPPESTMRFLKTVEAVINHIDSMPFPENGQYISYETLSEEDEVISCTPTAQEFILKFGFDALLQSLLEHLQSGRKESPFRRDIQDAFHFLPPLDPGQGGFND